jgi:hypothetical protein
LLFLLHRQVGVTAAPFRFVSQNGFTVASVVRVQLPDGLCLPAENWGHLRRPQTQRRPPPNCLQTLVFGFRFCLLQQRSKPLNGSFRKGVQHTPTAPPQFDPVYFSCCLMTNWYELFRGMY